MLMDRPVHLTLIAEPPFGLLCVLAAGFAVSVAVLVTAFAQRLRRDGREAAGAAPLADAAREPFRGLVIPGGMAIALFVWGSRLFVEAMIPSGSGIGVVVPGTGLETAREFAVRTSGLSISRDPLVIAATDPRRGGVSRLIAAGQQGLRVNARINGARDRR